MGTTWSVRLTAARNDGSLDQINDGFDLMKRGESIRSVVVY